MSLLLLFPNQPTTVAPVFCWTDQNTALVSSWATSHYDFLNIWGEWESYTWAQIISSGFTWDNLSGYMFVTTASPSTTWSNVTLPMETC